MNYFGIVIGLIGVMYLAIIGVYVWTYKVASNTNDKLGEIYKLVNDHMQKADIHTNKKEFVLEGVCRVLHTNIARDVGEIKEDVKSLLSRVPG